MQYQHFSIAEREEILCGMREKRSMRDIARALSRSPSSITREIVRNRSREAQRYTPHIAQARALEHRSRRGRTLRLKNEAVRSYVKRKLKLRWSPEQIAGRMMVDIGQSISPEAIYQFIYAQFNIYGALRDGGEDLRPYLRRRRKLRIPKGARRGQRVEKPHGPSIEGRPLVVAQRTRIGDWEGDTVESKDHKPGINTLVERKTGFVFITKLSERTGRATEKVVVSRLGALPRNARRTITFDNGPETSEWRSIEKEIGVRCFFAHPYHSWERGTNENTNGLIRDYFPKKTDFTMIQDVEIQKVEYDLNTRPRKRLGWRTPQEAFSVALQS